jgi:hypothetical protein
MTRSLLTSIVLIATVIAIGALGVPLIAFVLRSIS